MKDLKKYKMPYRESKEYVDNIVERATEKAISRQRSAKTHILYKYITAAAVTVILAGSAIIYYNHTNFSKELIAENSTSPVDDFLNSITDEEIQMLPYYEVEEIPEY